MQPGRKWQRSLWNSYARLDRRTQTSTLLASFTGVLLGVTKLILGLFLSSVWFVTNACYYLILAAARAQSVRQYRRIQSIQDANERYTQSIAVYRHGGIFMVLIGLSYGAICIRMFLSGDSATYFHPALIYGVAAIALIKLTMSVYLLLKAHRLTSPVVSSLRVIGLADACVSIGVALCAILHLVGSAQATVVSSIFGMVASVFFILTGLLMRFRHFPTLAVQHEKRVLWMEKRRQRKEVRKKKHSHR